MEPGGSPFAGRRAELDLLARCAAAAVAARPQVVLVEGEPGIGRTALVRRAAEALRGFTVVQLRCDPVERGARLQVVSRLLGRLGAAVDPGAGVADAGELLWREVARAQARRPLAVVVDDLHWADGISVDVLGYVLRRLFDERVLVVLTMLDPAADVTRCGPYPLDGVALTRRRRIATDHDASHELALAGLDLVELAELAAGHGHPAHPAGLAALHRYTAGHPARASMLLAEREPMSDADEPVGVPRAYLAQVLDGLLDLPEESRRLAEGLALLGEPCRVSLVARVGGVAEPMEALEPLLAAGFVRWRPADPVCPIEISHPMLGDGIYQTISPGRRRELHRRAAVVVDAHAVWRHRVRAVAGGADVALADELEHEADAALAVGDTAAAVRYLDWASELSDTRADRQRRAAAAVVHEPRRLGEDRAALRRIDRWSPGVLRDTALALARWHRGDDPAAVRRSLAGLRTRVPPGAPPWLADVITAALADIALAEAAWPQAVELADAVLARPVPLDLRTTLSAARVAVLGRVMTRGPVAAGRAVERLRLRTAPPDAVLPPARTGLVLERAVCLVLAGRHTAALAAAAVVLDEPSCAPGGDDHLAALLVTAHAHHAIGRWPAASAALRTAFAHGGGTSPVGWLLLAQAAVTAARAGWSTAAAEHADHLAGLVPPGPLGALVLAGVRAAAAGARDDTPALVAAFDVRPGWDHRGGPPPAGAGLLWVEALIAGGRLAEAGELLPVVAAAAGPGPGTARLSGLLAERTTGPDEALRHYLRAAETPGGADEVVLHRAQLEFELGRLLDDERSAVRWLRSARHRFVELGAAPFAQRCDVWLRKKGEAGIGDGPAAALTDREREVTDLVLDRLTNRQVAARLFISDKTVEFHLRNAYAKLGVRSRRELRARHHQ